MTTLLRRGWAALRGAPFSAALLLALWLAAVVGGAVRHGPGGRLLAVVGVGPGLVPHRWWTPLTSALYCVDLRGYVLTTLVVLAFAVPVERRLGSVRAAAGWAAVQLIAIPAGVLLLSSAPAVPGWWMSAPPGPMVTGPGPAVLGLTLAASADLTPLWRRRVRLVLVLVLVMLLYTGRPIVLLALVAGLVGLPLGPLLRRRRPRVRVSPPTRPEVRVLLGLAVAASAIGPFVATLTAQPAGPLGALRWVMLTSPPDLGDVRAACGDPDLADQCHAMLAQLYATGLGPIALSVLPAALMLLAAEGLRRGRRAAWWLAVLTNLAVATLSAIVFDVVPRLTGAPGDPVETVTVVAAVGQPLLIAALLAACRGSFPLVTSRRRRRDLWLLGVGGPAVAAAAYVCAGYLLRQQFDPAPTLTELLADLPLRFLPVGYLDAFPPTFAPRGPVATVLWGWTGTAGWLAVLTGIARTYYTDRPADAGDAAARTKRLLVEHGGDSLSYMVTWRDNRHWVSDDGRAAIAYRLVSAVALTLGGPVGDPAARLDAMRQFSRHCLDRGWTPCFYGITEEYADALRDGGWGLVQVAEETLLPLAGLSFRGRQWQDVRTALNRAGREGIEAQWYTFPQVPPALADKVRVMSDTWVVAKGLPELGFTLGGIDQLHDDEVRCLLALDGEGRLHAVTSWLPVHRQGRVVGWTLDMMRRRPDAVNGVMEFLVASAALRFQDEGAEFLSLSGAPLARRDVPPPTGLAHLLDRLGTTLEPVYGFRSLQAFKAKFQPVYRPLLLAYPDPAALPTIGNAVTRAYLPGLTPSQALRLLRRVMHRSRHHAPALPSTARGDNP